MATFSDRALTVATRGVLSGVALTIATNGILQLPQDVPVVVEPTPQPVAAAPARVRGPLSFEYSNQYRIQSEIRLGLGLDVEARYLPVPLEEYRDTANFFWSLDLSGESGASRYQSRQSDYTWGIDLSGASRADYQGILNPAPLKWAVDLSGASYGSQATRGLVLTSVSLGISPEGRSRGLAASPGSVEYHHIASPWDLRIQSRSWADLLQVEEYRYLSHLPVKAGFQINTSHQTVGASQGQSQKFYWRNRLDTGLRLDTPSFHEPIPVIPRTDDEEVLFAVIQILLSEDDDLA